MGGVTLQTLKMLNRRYLSKTVAINAHFMCALVQNASLKFECSSGEKRFPVASSVCCCESIVLHST